MKNRITKPGLEAMNRKVACQHCAKETTVGNIRRHESSCYLNPTNIIECVVCKTPIKDYKNSKGTCSRSCANTHFKTGEGNGNYKGVEYQRIAFRHHKKECIVCGEDKIVAVHHYDHNHSNNDPKNLVPLCPTHHSYVHSRYANEVLPIVEKYITEISTAW